MPRTRSRSCATARWCKKTAHREALVAPTACANLRRACRRSGRLHRRHGKTLAIVVEQHDLGSRIELSGRWSARRAMRGVERLGSRHLMCKLIGRGRNKTVRRNQRRIWKHDGFRSFHALHHPVSLNCMKSLALRGGKALIGQCDRNPPEHDALCHFGVRGSHSCLSHNGPILTNTTQAA